MPARRSAAARRRWSRSTPGPLVALAYLVASRWVRGGGGVGPRRLPWASRRLGVGRPLASGRLRAAWTATSSTAGWSPPTVVGVERRRNLTGVTLRQARRGVP